MNKTKRIILISVFLASLLLLLTIPFSFFSIYKCVKTNCEKAKKEYQEDCVNSLIKQVESNQKSFREKNSAIWALGQIADPKALPFLYELDQSLPEKGKCVYDQHLCKYEVQKAIKWCSQGNLTSWMYHSLL